MDAYRELGRSEHNISRQDMPTHVLKVLYRLKSKGYLGLLVGGALRDLLRGKEPRDFDVATDAPLEKIRTLFRNSKTIGKRFPIVHAYFGNEVVEISSLKGDDGDTGNRLIYADACRRDFTANAVFYNIDGFRIVDPLGAIDDIIEHRVVCIGDAETRFQEDPVRMLRAMKLVAKHGFHLDDELTEIIRSNAHHVQNISPGRKYEELTRILLDRNGISLLAQCNQLDVFKHLWPQGQNLANKYGMAYFDALRRCVPISYSRGSFAKHSHTHLWLKLYVESPYFKPSRLLEDHRAQYESFLEPLAMPFRAPILEAAICISQILKYPDRKPAFHFTKEVQKLLQFYVEVLAPHTPESYQNHIFQSDKVMPKNKGHHNHPRRRRRRRRGGRNRKRSSGGQ